MSIIAPGRRINPTIRRRSGIGRKAVYASLFLTSMVDMFAILVIFLLQSFSSEGELIVLPNGLQLPKAQNVGTLERAPSLVIAQDKILFEGDVVARTSDVAGQTEWEIPLLQKALETYKAKNPQPTGNGDSGAEGAVSPSQKINISADRRLPFQIVRKVIYNAGYVGFPDFRFAVFAGAKDLDLAHPKN